MPKILTPNYSTHSDYATGLRFVPVLNHSSGCYEGVADATPEQAETYAGRAGFRVFEDAASLDTFLKPAALMAAKIPAPLKSTGDPLRDGAAQPDKPKRDGKKKEAGALTPPPGPQVAPSAKSDQAAPNDANQEEGDGPPQWPGGAATSGESETE